MNKDEFFAVVREKLGRLSQMQVEGIEVLLKAVEGAPLSHRAYMLATAWHETDKTMQPVREAFRLSEEWRRKNLRYYPYYGRGYVQTTWLKNYRWLDEAAAKKGLTKPGEILANPDMAMRPDIAAFALREGMEKGQYDSRGKTMAQRLPIKGTATRAQYVNARYLVNIQDKAELVEDYAQTFELAFRRAGIA